MTTQPHHARPWLALLGLGLLAAPLAGRAQVLYSNGGTVFVNTGGALVVNGAAQQAGTALLRTTGTATVTGSLTSAAASTLDLSSGTLQVAGNLTNAGTTTATTGTLRLSGTTTQTLSLNGGTVGQLVVNRPSAGSTRVEVASDVTALTGVTLTAGLVRTASTATLILPPTATLTGEGPGQYVQGNVQVSRAVAGTTAVDFGNGAVIMAGGSNSLGTVAVTRTAGLQQAGTSYAAMPGGSPTNSIDRIWTINPERQPAAGTPATLQMSWPADDDGGLNTASLRASAQAFRQPSGGSYAAVGSAQDASARSLSVSVTAFSNWTVSAATTAPLPVELVAFAAQRQGEAARLTWATASEKNSAYFEVQVSADGASFRTIGQVAAAGSSLTRHDYAYLDAGLLSYSAPQVYYRLRQVDLDGTSTYSPVRVVAAEGAGLAVYPNPARGAVLVLRPAGAGTEAQLRNALGQVVRVLALPTTETPADLSGLAPGVYVLTLPGAGLARRVVVE